MKKLPDSISNDVNCLPDAHVDELGYPLTALEEQEILERASSSLNTSERKNQTTFKFSFFFVIFLRFVQLSGDDIAGVAFQKTYGSVTRITLTSFCAKFSIFIAQCLQFSENYFDQLFGEIKISKQKYAISYPWTMWILKLKKLNLKTIVYFCFWSNIIAKYQAKKQILYFCFWSNMARKICEKLNNTSVLTKHHHSLSGKNERIII